MKRLILTGLSAIVLSAAIAPTVKAETTAVQPAMASSISPIHQLKPFNLVHLAYQGHFRDQGIDSYSAFLSSYRTGEVSARDLVQVAIKTNRLPSSILEDEAYLDAVESQLISLDTD